MRLNLCSSIQIELRGATACYSRGIGYFTFLPRVRIRISSVILGAGPSCGR